jgi:CHASE3 domain sensor protein
VSAFGVALLLIVGTGAFSWLSTETLVADAQLVDHTHEVIENLGSIVSQLKDAETGQRGFVITGESRYLEPYDAGLEGVAVAVANVRMLTIDNASQQSLLDDTELLIQRKLDELSQTIELRRTSGFETALAVVITYDGKSTMDELRAIVSVMEQDERRLLEQRAEETASAAAITKFAVVIGAIMSTSIFSTIAIFLLWTNSRLDREVVVRMRTEAQREALIAELERFTYTVSHDLRSPLITVKGFLGALGQDAARGDTQRMQDDMDRISAAADNMTRLLDELLQLSRIGHVAGPPEELALGELAGEAVALVGGLLEDRQVRVTILDDLPPRYLAIESEFGKCCRTCSKTPSNSWGKSPIPRSKSAGPNQMGRAYALCATTASASIPDTTRRSSICSINWIERLRGPGLG